VIHGLRTQNGKSSFPQLPIIPKGVSRQTFNTAINELSQQLGAANVSVVDKPPKDDGWYMEHPTTHDMMSVVPSREFMASAVVYPSTTSDVQAIVLWANKYSVPLFPISMGRNLGYGGAAPRVPGSVVVDLGQRMNKILDIDPDDYTCLVEPGVSFYGLYEEIQSRGFKHMWIDTPDLGGGSVIGNTLDRGVGYTVC
jgi:FAD/FMN-containing dehydrogenase